jgi:transforming growth factor-beta-induced protein
MKDLKKQFNKITKFMLSLTMIAILFSVTSCNDDDEEPAPVPEKDIVELAQDTPVLSTLVTAINTANLASALKGDGPFTVFAPSNAAFEKLPDGVLATLLANPSSLAEVLQYHVVSGNVLSSDLSTGSVNTLLTGKTLSIVVSGASVTINGEAAVVAADQLASNGVVHIIDEVLIPEGFELPKDNIVEIAAATPELSILVEALTLFPDLVTALSGDGTFTVFAPTNDAFVALLGAIGQTQLSNVPESVVRDLLEYHVIASAAIMSGDLSDGDEATTLGGEDVSVVINGDGVFISGAKVIAPDVEASNGVVHVIDAVMVNPSILPIVGTIVAPAYFNKNFTVLTSAVLAADPSILELLLSDGPSSNGLTLFAPTNDAFAAAGITSLPDQATLNAVLAYHVIDATIMSTDLPITTTGAAPVMSLGGEFYLSNKGGDAGVFINGNTQVVGVDIEGSNGVVHVINRTLLPPSGTIVDIAVALSTATEEPQFTQLVAALLRTVDQNPDLVAALSGEGSFTVFAPTDAAFVALLASNDNWSSVDDIPLDVLTEVLLYHVIGTPRVFSSDLESGAATTLNGDITIDAAAGTIADTTTELANLIGTNVLATNGVIHVIDKVLIPTL